jgi:hypothetical protein
MLVREQLPRTVVDARGRASGDVESLGNDLEGAHLASLSASLAIDTPSFRLQNSQLSFATFV